MSDFKRRGKTWVLLTDVDEYITFNIKHDDDPPMPLDGPSKGIPMLSNWSWITEGFVDEAGQEHKQTRAGGIISGLPPEGWHGKRNGDPKRTLHMVNNRDELIYGAYGGVFTDYSGDKWFLRDDYAYRDAVDVTPEEVISSGMPIVKDSFIKGNRLHGVIYNDNQRKDGEHVEIPTNWRESNVTINTINGGHSMKDLDGKIYYVERDTYLWPPYLSAAESVEVRKRLPMVDSGKTVLDVLNSEMQRLGMEMANETIGPCLTLPRLLYGSHEDRTHPDWEDAAPEGFDDMDFVTLRYRWHSLPDNIINKYGKAIVDVSRIPSRRLKGEAENIHNPVKPYCRDPPTPRFSASFLRVNHYLDSFEAYSYRNDARADKRGCRSCYDKKGSEATKRTDDDIRSWLRSFVDSVGQERAKAVLAGAGNFLRLS